MVDDLLEQIERVEPWVPVFLFSVLFGLSNGLVTIVRGSLVPEYWGRAHVGRRGPGEAPTEAGPEGGDERPQLQVGEPVTLLLGGDHRVLRGRVEPAVSAAVVDGGRITSQVASLTSGRMRG